VAILSRSHALPLKLSKAVIWAASFFMVPVFYRRWTRAAGSGGDSTQNSKVLAAPIAERKTGQSAQSMHVIDDCILARCLAL